METNRGIEAFYNCKVLEIPDLNPLEPIPFKYVWNNFMIPIKRLSSLNYKPRKTTYKTVKRFSAKKNRK